MSYDFWPVFKPIATYLAMADYAVANLETRLAGPEFGYSGYPLFNSPDELAHALKYAGFDLVGTANNHSFDMGWEGIVGTLDRLDAAGVSHVGTYRSMEEKETPFIVEHRWDQGGLSQLHGVLPQRSDRARGAEGVRRQHAGCRRCDQGGDMPLACGEPRW